MPPFPLKVESPDGISARRAIPKTGIQGSATGRAHVSPACRRLDPRSAGFVEKAPATSAFQERDPFLYAKERHKEERKIMIHPFHSCLIESAGRAHAALVFDLHGLRLNPGDKKKHGCPRLSQQSAKHIKAEGTSQSIRFRASSVCPMKTPKGRFLWVAVKGLSRGIVLTFKKKVWYS